MLKSLSALILAGTLIPTVCVAGSLKDCTPVTQKRLSSPEPENWLMAKGNYAGWSYTSLKQVTAGNVKKLRPVWSYATGVTSGHEAPPIVNDGVMFVATPYNQVLAIDAKTGESIWRYKRDFPEGFSAFHYTNRGVALWADKVYVAGLDCRLVALDAKTGSVVWEATVCDWSEGAFITSAPVAVNGKIMIGPSGGEFGIRGNLKAYDAETGKEVWTFWAVPAPGEPGSETWPKDGRWKDAWKTGGGTMWMPGNYDVKNDVLDWGVGNGSPWLGDQRPGDNLYVASVVALNPSDGKLKGHFQYHWNDSWDWAAMNAPTLIDLEKNGKKEQALISAQRIGYLYRLDRSDDGKIGFRDARPFVNNTVFEKLDPKTGRPSYREAGVPGTGRPGTYCPSVWGGKDWFYESYNPKTGMLYIPFNDNHCMTYEGKIQERIPGQWSAGVDITDIKLLIDKDVKYIGGVQAVDVNTNKEVWRDTYAKSWMWGSILSTDDMIFVGGTSDRLFRAYDAKSGKELWSYKTNSGIIAPPISYSIDGKQYIAVVSGWGVDSALVQGVMAAEHGWEKDIPQGGTVWVFALED